MALVYSCCFWFSLRLGGILVALFSIVQTSLMLIAFCIAHANQQVVKDDISHILSNLIVIYIKGLLEDIKTDTEKYTSLGITFSCFYITTCIVYIYGAYTFNNVLMIGYIVLELLRLIVLCVLVATCLLVIKQNTMDIGILIGASVAGGFLLLVVTYLWVCATNLPILINEMERDELTRAITKLREIVEEKSIKNLNQNMNSSSKTRYFNTANTFVPPVPAKIPKTRKTMLGNKTHFKSTFQIPLKQPGSYHNNFLR